MANCCSPTAYGSIFDELEARRNARSYKKKGLESVARQMVEYLTGQGVRGWSVLEVGGGIGAIQLELLRAGATHTVNVELSPAYEAVASDLLVEAGVSGRVQRHIADFAADPAAFPSADVVVMHRVVCCYPNMTRLVSGASDRAERYLALSYPRGSWWVRAGLAVENVVFRIRRTGFQTYSHPPSAILATAAARGFTVAMQHRGWIWEWAILQREQGTH